MKYQIVIAGFGGQGVVFLVKVLAICAGNRDIPFLGTENHGMSQRGGSVSCDIKVGDFTNPVIDKNQADLMIALERNEGLRNVAFLKLDGTIVTNAKDKDTYPELPFKGFAKIDAFKKAENGEFPIQGLNVYMLGFALIHDKNFPFSIQEVKDAITQMNAKVAEQNIKILDQAMKDAEEQK
ncbi:Indolepyruvate oxidoreductase subunit iorB [Sulfurimonas gotlandica GD1]|uniref:Indolepyruvate oxidoreductase subunit iorB n=1 Tax=Sulfurimonas gotlandica (strain DSM 19862 / JCM 16533 / GD1) TaxID=929558 RepID=B6BND7_SULGG|nr:2-oxoacid:acceptor oxidoreductase family protein [Sulfurimonas gotlandica]EDZ61363.1 ferredoxin oxidoreductase [Sulfurimonas gotlandica GD1]EHP31007.1 Indolepyruvate oxidoreductase subunit iorB [Sulfurimonas gotlandica GD1]